MTLTELLRREKRETDNYIGYVEVWRSDRVGQLKIQTKTFKKITLFGPINIKDQISSDTHHRIYTDERFNDAVDRMENRLEKYEEDRKKFEDS